MSILTLAGSSFRPIVKYVDTGISTSPEISCWKYSSSSPNKSPRHRTTLKGPAFVFKDVSLLIASFSLPFAEPRTRTRTEAEDMKVWRNAKLVKKGSEIACQYQFVLPHRYYCEQATTI